MNANLDAMASALRARRDSSLRWDSSRYPKETHDSVVIKSDFDALRMIFAGWDAPRDPDTNALSGSLQDIERHYATLGERLGYPLVAPEGTVNEYGYECLQTKHVDAALEAFRTNTKLHPNSANAWDSLGDGLVGAGKKADALDCYRKAVALAEAQGSPLLENFRKHAAQLTGAGGPDVK
jgi:tetratricopeptide (TPR) repeat protein